MLGRACCPISGSGELVTQGRDPLGGLPNPSGGPWETLVQSTPLKSLFSLLGFINVGTTNYRPHKISIYKKIDENDKRVIRRHKNEIIIKEDEMR